MLENEKRNNQKLQEENVDYLDLTKAKMVPQIDHTRR